MNSEQYLLKSNSFSTRFDFISKGNKGCIHKLIEFQETTQEGIYNLAFGDYDPILDKVDDLAVSNNGDTEKILATIANAVQIFLNENPTTLVYAIGSTKARTRLYRIGISKYFNDIKKDFVLYGEINNSFEVFQYNKNYDAFLIRKRGQYETNE